MKRRKAIQNIVLASSAIFFLPACSEKKAIDQFFLGKFDPDQRHIEYLGHISEAILPVQGISDKIGDSVPFILSMMNDCRSKEELNDFAIGFDQYKDFMREAKLKIHTTAKEAIAEKIKELLDQNETSDEMIHFIESIRELSIQHLMASEYYMSEYMGYRLTPGTYVACVDI